MDISIYLVTISTSNRFKLAPRLASSLPLFLDNDKHELHSSLRHPVLVGDCKMFLISNRVLLISNLVLSSRHLYVNSLRINLLAISTACIGMISRIYLVMNRNRAYLVEDRHHTGRTPH
jgi:hypothetical protein